MARLCKFTDADGTNPIFVNPLTVRHVDSYSPETVTVIHFDEHHAVEVSETTSDVVKALNDALSG